MSKALIKFIRLSPTKARLIAREVQGMNAELAMASLKFMPNKGAKYIANAISSAVANGSFEANEVVVKSCRVDAGAVLKRFRPRARGSASRIRKPTSHILVEVAKAEVKTEAKKAVAKKTPVKKTSTKKVTAEKES
ncbi:50S ribosomal protein L22 [Campylobacter coli]|nr:50S ribosomal protein L22 [Campylobacter coli]EHY6512014.1 50S ribosomal protein L22 [Campylobacter coli]EMD1207607.1 50S ribosomal protein L22 [Campylobacter coli]EME3330612.1 50S ribosomal protein L22 [Campylobacter coli]